MSAGLLPVVEANAAFRSFAARVSDVVLTDYAQPAQAADAIGIPKKPVDRADQVESLDIALDRLLGGVDALADIGQDGRVDDRHRADEDLTGRAVDGDDIALTELGVADLHGPL